MVSSNRLLHNARRIEIRGDSMLKNRGKVLYIDRIIMLRPDRQLVLFPSSSTPSQRLEEAPIRTSSISRQSAVSEAPLSWPLIGGCPSRAAHENQSEQVIDIRVVDQILCWPRHR